MKRHRPPGDAGGVAVQILGTALLVLLLTGGLGLAEAARASAARTAALRSLAAAVQSAAGAATEAEARAVFSQVLAANLGRDPYQADLHPLAAGAPDPATGRPVPRAALSGRLRFTYRLQYLGRLLPPLPVDLHHTALWAPERNGKG
jgi:hypothetical protein